MIELGQRTAKTGSYPGYDSQTDPQDKERASGKNPVAKQCSRVAHSTKRIGSLMTATEGNGLHS